MTLQDGSTKTEWKCQCGHLLDGKDRRLVPATDEYEILILLRCQHCGQETPLYFDFYTNEPGFMIRSD